MADPRYIAPEVELAAPQDDDPSFDDDIPF
jgi:hypothetical protein